MDNDIRYPQAVHATQFTFHLDDKSVIHCLKTVTIITALATTVLSSAYLAYQNTSLWWLSTCCIFIGNLYVLPKILHFGNSTMIKIALVTNFTALGSLALGGMTIATFSLSKHSITFLKTYQLSSALFNTFWITGLLGYGMPFFRGMLEKVYCMLNKEEWQDRFYKLHDQFQRIPELGLGFLQTNLWDSFVLHLSFLKPEFILNFYHLFNVNPPNYVWSIIAATNQVTLDQFRNMIASMEQVAELAMLQDGRLPEDIKDGYCRQLKTALKSIKKENLHEAITMLLSNGSKLVPLVISNQQFLELFVEDTLDAANALIQQFLDLLSSWPNLHQRYLQLESNIIQLENEIKSHDMQQLTPQKEDNFLQSYNQLAYEFNKLRTEIEKIYFNKRIWQSLSSSTNDGQMLEKRFIILDLRLFSDALSNQSLVQEIDQTYRSMINTSFISSNSQDQLVQQVKSPTLHDHFQYIANKIAAIQEKDNEPLSAVMFLGANKQFIQKDFENLQEWLNLDSPHDLEDAMKSIGLGNEEDLYEKKILSRQSQVSKFEICQNLRHYIERIPKPYLAHHIQPRQKIDKDSLLNTLLEKLTRILYHVIVSGLILVPVLISPHLGVTGFAVGLSFFVLKRFGIPGTQTIANFSEEIIDILPFGEFLFNLMNRRIFSLTPRRREESNQFVNAHFSERMQMINWQIFFAIFVTHFSPRIDIPALGGFFQGIALAREIVDFV